MCGLCFFNIVVESNLWFCSSLFPSPSASECWLSFDKCWKSLKHIEGRRIKVFKIIEALWWVLQGPPLNKHLALPLQYYSCHGTEMRSSFPLVLLLLCHRHHTVSVFNEVKLFSTIQTESSVRQGLTSTVTGEIDITLDREGTINWVLKSFVLTGSTWLTCYKIYDCPCHHIIM